MTTENPKSTPTDIQPQSTPTDIQPPPFGKRLQSTREAMNLERSEVASSMRLNEKIILMMEKNRYTSDIPVTYIKGYLRSYAKLLNIPEHETKKALDNVKPRPVNKQLTPNTKPIVISSHTNNYFMNIFTSLIIFSILGLIGIWWYSHNPLSSKLIVSNSNAASINKIISPLPDQTTNTNDPAASTETAQPAEKPAKAPAVTKVAAAKVTPPAANIQNFDDEDEDENNE